MALWEIIVACAVGMTGYLTINVGRNAFYFELVFGYWPCEKPDGGRSEKYCSKAAVRQLLINFAPKGSTFSAGDFFVFNSLILSDF